MLRGQVKRPSSVTSWLNPGQAPLNSYWDSEARIQLSIGRISDRESTVFKVSLRAKLRFRDSRDIPKRLVLLFDDCIRRKV